MKTLGFLFVLTAIIGHGCLETQGQVISQPDNVTTCEGRGAVFTCVLNSNISSDDVQWYRFIKDTSTTEMLDPNGENITYHTHINGSTINSSLTITNAIKSYTGYFWVGTPSLNVCNASLTVTTSPPALRVNITKNPVDLSIVVQWDAVDDSLPTTYTIIWRDEGDLFEVTTLLEQTSYTITGLTLDTVYTITVNAANRCGNGAEVSTRVSFSTDTTSTTSSISPTVTASTNPMIATSTENPSTSTTTTGDTSSSVTASTTLVTTVSGTNPGSTTTTVTVADASSSTTTTSGPVMDPSTTTTNLMTTTVSTHTSATMTTVTSIKRSATTAPAAIVSSSSISGITTVTTSRDPSTTFTTTTITITDVVMSSTPNPVDVTSDSDSSVGIIIAAVIGGIIIVAAIFIMISCFVLCRKQHGKAVVDDGITLGQYRDNKKFPSIHNAMIIYDENDDEPYKLRKDTSHDMSIAVSPYTVIDVGDSTFHPSHPNDKIGSPKPSNADDRSAPPKGETDTQQQYSVEYAIVDRSKKKSRKGDKQQNVDNTSDSHTDNGVQHITVPTVTAPSNDDQTNDGAVKNKNNPALHYAELELLPPPTGRYTVSDESPTIYAQVA